MSNTFLKVGEELAIITTLLFVAIQIVVCNVKAAGPKRYLIIFLRNFGEGALTSGWAVALLLIVIGDLLR